jgi:UDP-N-acetyl-D-galactosamine dehydrogenase
VDIHDPWVSSEEARHEYGLTLVADPDAGVYDAVVLAVGHREFAEKGIEWLRTLAKPEHVLFDIKQVLPREAVTDRL